MSVEALGTRGIFQSKPGSAPAEVEVLGVKGVFGSVRGKAPSKAAAVAQGREAESNSEGVRAFLASHPDAELLPGGVVVRCTKTCYEMPAQLEDMEAHWKGRRYRRGYTTERKRREPAAKAEAIDAPVATNKKEEPTVDPLHAFVASHADAEFLPTGEPWATQPLPYLPSCLWWSYLTVNHHPAVDHRTNGHGHSRSTLLLPTAEPPRASPPHPLRPAHGRQRPLLDDGPRHGGEAAHARGALGREALPHGRDATEEGTHRTNAPHAPPHDAHAATHGPRTRRHAQPCTATHAHRACIPLASPPGLHSRAPCSRRAP